MRALPHRTPTPLRGAVRRNRSAHDATLHRIGMAIVSGRFPVDALLPSKEDLMLWLDVSHTTLREALQTIAAKGMVAAKARVGTRILDESHWSMFDADILSWRQEAGLSRAFLAGLFEVRQGLEPLAAALAATRRSDAEAARLRHMASVLNFASGDLSAVAAAVTAFHHVVLQVSRNPFMATLAATVGMAVTAATTARGPMQRPELVALRQRQFAEVAGAIAARDPQRAGAAMTAVVRQDWVDCSGADAPALARIDLASFGAP